VERTESSSCFLFLQIGLPCTLKKVHLKKSLLLIYTNRMKNWFWPHKSSGEFINLGKGKGKLRTGEPRYGACLCPYPVFIVQLFEDSKFMQPILETGCV